VSARDQATARRLSAVLEALLHLDGEVRRHAEPRFLVEATLARLAVESAGPMPNVELTPPTSPLRGEVASRSEAGGDVTPPIAGWSTVLEKLNRTVRAAYLDAQPEVSDKTLVLWFRYGFHHKKAQEQSAQLMPLVREWLGPGVTVDYRLRDMPAEAARPAKTASPEDDPFVREVVRRFEGRVTRVKEITE
jgi:hypothetical protein